MVGRQERRAGLKPVAWAPCRPEGPTEAGAGQAREGQDGGAQIPKGVASRLRAARRHVQCAQRFMKGEGQGSF